MKISKLIVRESPTLYFLLVLVGFELVASLLIPPPSPDAYLGFESYEERTAVTQVYTIPYRAFSLLVMLIVLLFYKLRGGVIYTVSLFITYYILWLVRLTYDLLIRTDIPITLGPRQIIFTLMGFLSIYVIRKAYWHLDLNRVFKLIIILQTVCVFGMLIRNPLFVLAASEIQGRTQGSVGLNTISTANMAMSLVMMIVYWFVDSKHKLRISMKVVLSVIVLVSLVIGLRASSRGPIVTFGIVLVFYFFCISKYKNVGIAVVAMSILLFLLFKDQLIEMIGYISPVLQERFQDKGESGLQREEMASLAINGFLNHPIFGYAYGVMFQGAIGYPHNTVLEAFNGLGIIGGILYLTLIYHGVKESYVLLHAKEENAWVCLLFMVRLVESMFSGNFYNDEALCMLWVSVFMYYHDWKAKKTALKLVMTKSI